MDPTRFKQVVADAPVSPVNASLDAMTDAVALLANALTELEARLEPVLWPLGLGSGQVNALSQTARSDAVTEMRAPLVNRLDALNMSLSESVSRVRALINGVQL